MSIGEALKFIRKTKKFTQERISSASFIDRSSYARIEGDKQDVRMQDLQLVLKNLDINPIEFVSFSELDYEQQTFRDLYYYCARHPKNKKKKTELINYYRQLDINEDRTLREFSNLITIKAFFHQFWKEVEPIASADIDTSYQILSEKPYYFQYDYVLVANMIHHFSAKQADIIIMKAFPMKDENKRDYTTKNFAYNAMLNIITKRIYDGNYDLARKYINIAEKQDKLERNYSYSLTLQYLKELLELLLTGKPSHYNNILTFIDVLNMMGDHEHADQIEDELKLLTHDRQKGINRELPIGLVKDG